MPQSDNSFEEEESHNSDECEKGKGSKSLMTIVSSAKITKFKRVAKHKKVKDDSVSLSSDEEEIRMS
jgi:hypothetical protein